MIPKLIGLNVTYVQ
jgi:hypothetical protein